MAAIGLAGLSTSPPVLLAETGNPPKLERITIDGLVPWHRAEKPIMDGEGRIRVIVDLMDEATERQLEAARPLIERFDPKRDRHNPQALLAIEAFERRHGIEPQFRENERGERERSNVTSWVGASVTAYLTAGQIEAIRRDPDVRLVTEDRFVAYSFDPSPPPWNFAWNGPPWSERLDWGWIAVNGRLTGDPASQRSVYVLDSGVAHHADLPNVIVRTNVNPTGAHRVVGCYAHATHVAGIIGAAPNNMANRVGVYPSARIISVTAGYGSAFEDCVMGTPTVEEVGYMIDFVKWHLFQSGEPMAVVNLSMNWAGTGVDMWGYPETNHTKVLSLTTPGWLFGGYYPGALFVQSVGNAAIDACSTRGQFSLNGHHYGYFSTPAFKPSGPGNSAHPSDGVIVVGALNSQGGAASVFTPSNPEHVAGHFGGTNTGNCVDLWAPGDAIHSTWGQGGSGTRQSVLYTDSQPTTCEYQPCDPATHSGWARLSGTSMAAPHVAAAAAYLADTLGIQTPQALEWWLRHYAVGGWRLRLP